MPGLENPALKLFLVLLAVLVFAWGFERYRTRFSKLEFSLAVLVSLGVLTVGVFPDIFSSIGAVLNLESRSLVVSLLANTGFIILILYLASLIRNNQTSISELNRRLTVNQAAGERTADQLDIAVVIPAYNESESIGAVVRSLPDSIREHSVTPLVVSDGSGDSTAGNAREAGAEVVEHLINQGQGGALKTGFEIARRRGAEVVVTMDADGQHPVEELPALVTPILDNEADYVVGSRYIGRDRSDNGPIRRAGIRVFTALINFLTKAEVTDCTNGYRAIRGSSLGQLTLTEERFSAPELIIEARKNGLRIREIPVTIQTRQAGSTKKPQLGYAAGLARTIIITWFR